MWRILHKEGSGRRNHNLHLLLWRTSSFLSAVFHPIPKAFRRLSMVKGFQMFNFGQARLPHHSQSHAAYRIRPAPDLCEFMHSSPENDSANLEGWRSSSCDERTEGQRRWQQSPWSEEGGRRMRILGTNWLEKKLNMKSLQNFNNEKRLIFENWVEGESGYRKLNKLNITNSKRSCCCIKVFNKSTRKRCLMTF